MYGKRNLQKILYILILYLLALTLNGCAKTSNVDASKADMTSETESKKAANEVSDKGQETIMEKAAQILENEAYIELVKPSLEFSGVRDFHEGIAAVMVGDEDNEKFGFVDENGSLITEIKYTEVGDFSDGLAWVAMVAGEHGKQYGYIDRSGNEVIPLQFSFASDFKEGVAAVNTGNGGGYIGNDGGFVIAPKYKGVDDFSEGCAVLYEIAGNVERISDSFITLTGEEYHIEDCRWIAPFSNGLALVRSRDNDGNYTFRYIDKTGNLAIPQIFKSEKSSGAASSFREGLAAVYDGNGWGFIDTDGNVVVPCIYDSVKTFKFGYAVVESDGNFGVVDTSGNFILPLQNIEFESIGGGLFATSLEGFGTPVYNLSRGKYCPYEGKDFVDISGDSIFPEEDEFGISYITYDKTPPYDGVIISWSSITGMSKFIKTDGTLLAELPYVSVLGFSDDISWVTNYKNEDDVYSGEVYGIIKKNW